jgi:hypothetical protein
MSTIHEAFEAKYQRSAEDPSSAEMLAFFTEGYQAATERAAKQEREECAKLCEQEVVEELTDGDLAYNTATRHCAAAIRAKGGEA